MFVFKSIYCRIFQGAFRLALPILPYREPEIINSLEYLSKILQSKKLNSVLIVTDKGIIKNCLVAPLEAALSDKNINYVIYDGTMPNPTVDNVEEALKIYIENNCNAIIAIGGGSSMDCAKALGARVAYPKKKLSQLKGILKIHRKLPPLVAIPTTAGTGSEVTLATIITDSAKHHKYALMDFTLIPRYAVLDPSVTFSLPPHLTATTGMDALTHAVEAYIGRSTTKETRRLALEATNLVFENIENAYTNGYNQVARENMLHAAYKAGLAFSKSYVGYIHAVAHSLGGQYGTPHGLANTVIMPYVLEAYGKKIHKKLHKLAIAAGIATYNDTDKEAAEKFIKAIKTLNSNMGIPDKISGILEEDIPVMAAFAEKEANPLYPVPVLMTQKELSKFNYQIADWSNKND